MVTFVADIRDSLSFVCKDVNRRVAIVIDMVGQELTFVRVQLPEFCSQPTKPYRQNHRLDETKRFV